jgi:hypothetical protein
MDSARKAFAVSAVIFALSGAVFAAGPDQGKQLSDKYKDRVLALRHPLMAPNQNYGFNGEPLTGAAEGPWTLFGRIQIKDIVADDKELRVKGTRVLCEYTKNGLELVYDKEKVTITVRLNSPLASEDEAVAVLGRVFSLTPEEIINSAPDYWRDFLSKNSARWAGTCKVGSHNQFTQVSACVQSRNRNGRRKRRCREREDLPHRRGRRSNAPYSICSDT